MAWSIDFTAAARSELLAGSLPDYPDTRAIVHIKATSAGSGRARDTSSMKEVVSWQHGPCSITAAQLLAAPSSRLRPERTRQGGEWLREQLAMALPRD